MKRTLKREIAEERIDEIGAIQTRIQQLRDDYVKDFSAAPPALYDMHLKDLASMVGNLELLKGTYKSKRAK
jgi:hypothetical protein